ncbi:DNA polymerase-3 subunit alpha [Thermoactinomyces sp. DSM 45891]|uniref:DNA polymerase III subunit alpha n=1 Tax=Thermoactinomyces sp. DSM 45891 TaxID=1761907 RepID=UPI000920E414|nr:DNA polymerase III subunit alpha [Thermoactinomyces sp. DSM 45891]SFX59758.1 DNA polymerase-3 subunit alpha [Thermoactinomyces sp. DSM 45891]
MKDAFVHLHVHSEYSLLDGAGKIEQLIQTAKGHGMKALAITDHGAMYGVIPFYQACLEAGIKPIIGCEMYMSENYLEKPMLKEQKICHQLLLAESTEGYHNLIRLTTEAHLRGFHYKPRIDRSLLRKYRNGLIATSSCLGGEIPQAILQDDDAKAQRLLEEYVDIFGRDHFFLELQDHQIWEQQKVNQRLISWANEYDLGLIATNDIHYVHQDDDQVHDCLLCIGTGKKVEDENRLRFASDQFYFKSAEEMIRQFSHVPEAIANTVKIAERCDVEISFGERLLPEFPLPQGVNSSEYLRTIGEKGARKRYGELTDEIKQRLQYELDVIDQMGFADYFLVVWDLVSFAHRNQIAIGPGRGSAAGSLVSYVLEITDVDPVKYQLLFERFLNPERISMPDIDIDICYERREEVIRYVTEKYGNDRVAQIITFGTMAPRAAIRDLGRVLNFPYQEVDRMAKLIPGNPGMTLKRAFQLEPKLEEIYQSNPQMAQLVDYARRIEGIPRHTSTHAAGVVMSKTPLTDWVPLQEGADGVSLTQYAMEALEQIGLLKMDFLGLRNLSVIEKAIEMIRRDQGVQVSFEDCDYQDKATYRLLAKGETTGVFQLESSGIRKVLRELKPNHFEDIVAVLALYRPGPMEQIPRYTRAKHGLESVSYPHPALREILRPTYGIIVYQEQIMQIAATLAGFSLGQADILRRAVSKKKKELLDEQRKAFTQGCVENGFEEEVGHQIYDLIVRFADYGFNRSHAVAYAVLAYQTAYLKANYPQAYLAAQLSTMMGNQGKVAEYMEEAKRMGVSVLPPDIQHSRHHFTIEGNQIRFGLAAIKNIGIQAIDVILQAREKGPFVDLRDFCRRIDLRICNRRVLESLILCGATESLPGHRASQKEMLEEVLEKTSMAQKWGLEDQIDLFKDSEDLFFEEPLTRNYEEEITPYSSRERIQLEKEYLGLFLSGHPLDEYQSRYQGQITHRIHQLEEITDGASIVLAGIVIHIKSILTKKGDPMAFVELEDQSGTIEVVVFPNTYRRARSFLQEEQPLLIKGVYQGNDESGKCIANQIIQLDESNQPAGYRADQQVQIFIRTYQETSDILYALKLILKENVGKTPVQLVYERTKKGHALPVQLYGVNTTLRFQQEVEALLGDGSVRISVYN